MDAPHETDLCVHCRKRPVDPAWRPFCSERCRLLDLGAWLGDRYRIPGETRPRDEDLEEGDDDDHA